MFEYIGGKDGEGPDVLRAWGHVFKRDVPVKIEAVIVNGNKIGEAHISGKLRGNSHFREVDGRSRKKKNGDKG